MVAGTNTDAAQPTHRHTEYGLKKVRALNMLSNNRIPAKRMVSRNSSSKDPSDFEPLDVEDIISRKSPNIK
jgi:hypothetical protein